MTRFSNGTAFLFAGQGDQAVGMGRALYERCPLCRDLFHTAAAAVALPLLDCMFAGPAERLDQTEMAQPATLVQSVAEAQHLRHTGHAPDVLLGHSVGHLSALVVAGALSLPDAVRLAALRGRLMQAAVPLGDGAMAAVLGLAADAVEAACRSSEPLGPVAVACYNAPGRLVISGATAAVQAAMAACEAAGGAVLPLAVSAPCHSPLMAPAVPAFAAAVADLSLASPALPVLDGGAARYLATSAAVATSLVAHLTTPVRFELSLRRLAADGVGTFLHCGPGAASIAFARRTVRGARTSTARDVCAADHAELAA